METTTTSPVCTVRNALALAVLSILLGGCLPTTLQFTDGPASDGLRPIAPVPFEAAWARPGTSFAGYNAVVPRFAGITYRRPPREVATLVQRLDNYPLPEELNEELMKGLAEIFAKHFDAYGWRRISKPGPGALIAKVSVIDLVVRAPLARTGDEQAWVDSIGAFTVVIELYDGETRKLVARAAERSAISSGTPSPLRTTVGDTTYASRRVFRDWARKLNRLLDDLRSTRLADSGADPSS